MASRQQDPQLFHKSKTVSVTVEIPEQVLELIDTVSRSQLQTRSSFIRGAVLKELRTLNPQLVNRLLEEPARVRNVLNDIANMPRGK